MDVIHTLDIIKNLFYGFLLNKLVFSHSIGVDLYTIIDNYIFVNKIENRFSKNEGEALDMFTTFMNESENQFGKQIKRFRNDNELSMILVYLMNFINMKLYMKPLHRILMK